MSPTVNRCSTPRCDEASAGIVADRWFQQCPQHALEYVIPRLASLTAQAEALAGMQTGQLHLIDGGAA
jgi:hypothetical protein